MTAIEPFGQPQHRGERPDRPPQAALQSPVPLVGLLWCRLAMIARQQRDNLDLLRIEPAQPAVLDQVIRAPRLPLVADMEADIVRQGAVFTPFTLVIGQPVDRARLI